MNLQTTIQATQSNSGSVLKSLRDLMPTRALTFDEALQRAEVQASRLLSLQNITFPSVPSEIVTELPKIEVRLVRDMPASGSSHWEEGRWLIHLNEFDHPTRQRFSLLHEYKHILDHTLGSYIESKRIKGEMHDHEQLAERVADHFAACVLMPKGWVKTAFCSRTQSVTALAEIFDVSPKAMNFRLTQLGLTSIDRCMVPRTIRANLFDAKSQRLGVGRRYFRPLATPEPVITPELVGANT
jgi:Zn-dependent peptidase ImmA (M78 family)